MTPKQFNNCIKGYNEREKAQWERTRILSFFTIKPHLKKNSNATAESILKFPWDSKSGSNKLLTRDELEALRKRAREFDKKISENKYGFTVIR